MFLKNLNIKYNKVISDKIYLIDPAESLAHELYTHLIKNNQWGNNSYANSEFYISVPNPILITSQINNNWEFPYTYKYGRSINSSEQYVKIVPFSDKWINSNIKQRLKQDIPATYNIIYKNQNTLKYKKPISNQL
jgi:hypothetical protein